MTHTYLALVHYPVLDRTGDTVTTAITNLDVHDLSRTARTYDLESFFVVTPVEAQRRLAQGILDHWRDGGPGHARVPERSEALARCRVVESVDAAADAVRALEGSEPWLVATAARPVSGVPLGSFAAVGEDIAQAKRPHLLLFGTGHGLAEELIRRADILLPPVRPGGYNHLSVRAAAAIVLDRLFGDRRRGGEGDGGQADPR